MTLAQIKNNNLGQLSRGSYKFISWNYYNFLSNFEFCTTQLLKEGILCTEEDYVKINCEFKTLKLSIQEKEIPDNLDPNWQFIYNFWME